MPAFTEYTEICLNGFRFTFPYCIPHNPMRNLIDRFLEEKKIDISILAESI